MILLGSTVIRTPIISIQTGAIIAQTTRALVDPAKLNIEAYEVKGDRLTSKQRSYIRVADIREVSDIGAIVDSEDELVQSDEIIKINELEKLNFNIVGMLVVDERRKKIGKVIDYTIDMSSFYIQQLSVKRPFMKSLNDTELLIHRTQIIEINNNSIVVHSEASAPEPERSEVPGSYINPFRKAAEPSSEQHAAKIS